MIGGQQCYGMRLEVRWILLDARSTLVAITHDYCDVKMFQDFLLLLRRIESFLLCFPNQWLKVEVVIRCLSLLWFNTYEVSLAHSLR